MKNSIYIASICALLLAACGKVNFIEQTQRFPQQEWAASVQPTASFDIQDTSSLYHIYVVLRHTDAYRYNNIWLNVISQSPNDSPKTQLLNIALADNTKGWLGSGMDDIYDRRARITLEPIPLRKGLYTFKLQQAMREDPLAYIMSAGMRVEKVQP
ncbi:MAG: gliding motility lipoprotein GldH [Chitinophagaceae bacterium]|nr:gliding motility lipoprotein GldH [Chitinophagaceae bacterium]